MVYQPLTMINYPMLQVNACKCEYDSLTSIQLSQLLIIS